MMTVSPKMTMLPPIWVAAWASQRSRNALFWKTARALPVVVGLAGRVTASASRGRAVATALGDVVTAALSAGSPRATNPASRRSRTAARGGRGGRRSGSAARCRRRAGRPARCRRRTDGRAGAGRRRRGAARGRAGRSSARQGIKGAAGRGRDEVAGRRRQLDPVDRRDRDATSGLVAASWAMIPPARVSDPVSVSGAPIAADLERVAERRVVDRRPGRPAADDDARSRPGRRRSRSPRRRRCAAR